MNEKDALLRDIEILERKKTGLEREVELLDKKYKSIKIGVDEFTNIKGKLGEQVGDIQREVSVSLTVQSATAQKTKEAQEKFEETKQNIQLTIKGEVISLLDEIRVLETVIEQKKISYGDFLKALKIKNTQLEQKEENLREINAHLEDKEHKLATQTLESNELLNKLKLWEVELKESDSTLQEQGLSVGKLKQEYKGQSEYFKKEADIFINNVESWYRNIESKRKLIVAVSNLINKRQYGAELANEHIASQKLWLEDQRVSLQSAWDELKILQNTYGKRNE